MSEDEILDFSENGFFNFSSEESQTIFNRKIDTNQGSLLIQTRLEAGYTIGDLAFLDGETAPDGKYSYGWPSWLEYFVIEDGRISAL